MFVAVRRWLFWTRTDRRAAHTYKWLIEPSRPGLVGRIEEFWRYRRILYFLSSQTLRSQYQGSTFGILWLFWTRTDRRAANTYKGLIEPSRPGLVGRIEEFWRYRRILYFLSSQTLRSQY